MKISETENETIYQLGKPPGRYVLWTVPSLTDYHQRGLQQLAWAYWKTRTELYQELVRRRGIEPLLSG